MPSPIPPCTESRRPASAGTLTWPSPVTRVFSSWAGLYSIPSRSCSMTPGPMPAWASSPPPTSAKMPGTMGMGMSMLKMSLRISLRGKISTWLGRPISPATVTSPLGANRTPAVPWSQGAICTVADPPP